MISKEKIHHLVDACNNDNILQEIESVLEQSENEQDWWQQLPDAEKEKTLASLEQLAHGRTLSHQQVMERI